MVSALAHDFDLELGVENGNAGILPNNVAVVLAAATVAASVPELASIQWKDCKAQFISL